MGSSFFHPTRSTGFGRGSTLGKIGAAVQPVAKYTRFVSPGASVAYNQGDQYNRGKYVATSPTPFAGRQPTLADANAGYTNYTGP